MQYHGQAAPILHYDKQLKETGLKKLKNSILKNLSAHIDKFLKTISYIE